MYLLTEIGSNLATRSFLVFVCCCHTQLSPKIDSTAVMQEISQLATLYRAPMHGRTAVLPALANTVYHSHRPWAQLPLSNLSAFMPVSCIYPNSLNDSNFKRLCKKDLWNLLYFCPLHCDPEVHTNTLPC